MNTERVALFDAHNHLQDDRIAGVLGPVLEDCRRENIHGFVVNGTCESDWPRIADLSQRDERVLPSYGVHPWHVDRCSAAWLDHLRRQLDTRPSAIGEIGLDRWMREPDLLRQEEIFIAQLRLANERQLPVTVHCLKAWGRLLEILQSETPRAGFLLHSYSGPAEMLPRFTQLGAYFSMSGHFAHERKHAQQRVFKEVPDDRLLIETDAPDMPPPSALRPYSLEDAALNHPANLAAIYRFTARLRGLSVDDLATTVAANFKRLFSTAD